MKLTYNKNGAQLTKDQRDAINAWLTESIADVSVEELERSGITRGSIVAIYYDHKKYRDGAWSKKMQALETVNTNLFSNVLRNGYSLASTPDTEPNVTNKNQKRGTHMNNPQTEKAPAWAELRSDHIEEENGFIICHIDAWKTGNGDEEGEVIAKVIGVNLANNEPSVYISYQNVVAMVDESAQEVILEAKEDLLAQLHENAYNATLPPVVSRTRIALDAGKVIHVYVTTQEHGAKEQVAVARISALNIKPNAEVRATPVAQYLLPGKPSPEVAAEIQAAIADLTAELHK